MPRVVIVGAGISGLSAAYRLQQRRPDCEILVLEAAERPGGTTWTLREDRFQMEIGPNGFLDTKPTTLQLCRDLGLEGSLVPGSEAARKNRFLFLNGKLQALPGGLWPFVTSGLLSWRGKLALLTERWRRPLPEAVDESIDAFARRRTSAEVAETLADAMVTGIYAGDPRLLSLPACFPRLATMEREHGSVMKGFAAAARQRREARKLNPALPARAGTMWSFAGGLRVLIEALTQALRTVPEYGTSVQGLTRDGVGWLLHRSGHEPLRADAVLLTCPAHEQAKLLNEFDVDLAQQVGAIAYNRIVVAGLGYRRSDVPISLEGFGFIAPQGQRRDLLGVQWCSSIYPDRAPADTVLMRALCGGWHRPEIVDWDDAALLRALREELRVSMGITAEPIFHRVIRWPRAIPQYHVGHLARVAMIEARTQTHAGLHLGGNAYHGVALNDCTEQGDRLAERIAANLRAPS